MARRAYAQASIPQSDRQAGKLIEIICKQDWKKFTSREVLRLNASDINRAADLNPVLAVLEEGDVIRTVEIPSGSQGGRPTRVYRVNPLIFEKSHFGSA